METASRPLSVTVEEYLAAEEHSDIRHEYIAGNIYAMAGASDRHNLISGNIYAALHSHLRGKTCRVFMSDLKLRVQAGEGTVFYYPDLMVVCDSSDRDRFFKRFPKVLIEVLSETTERTDRGEKFLTYMQLDSLDEYVPISQDRTEITVFRRANGWKAELSARPEDILDLRSLQFSMALAAVYDGVEW